MLESLRKKLTIREKALSYLCYITSFMLAFIYSFISLDLSQKEIAFRYLGAIVIAIALCSIIAFLVSIFKNHRLSSREALTILFVVFILLDITIVSFVHSPIDETAKDTFIEMTVKTIPAILLAIVAARKNILRAMTEVLDVFVLVMSIGYIRPLIGMLIGGVTRGGLFSTFGVDYQTISYYSAYWFCLDLFMIFVGVKYIQSNMRRSIGFQIIRIVCAIILFITSLSTGGRGGFILIVADILFWFVLYMVRRKRYKQLVVSVAFLIIGYFVVNNIIGKSVSLQLGFARVFEFIGPEGFNWAGTSGRDVIYQKVINIIKQSPIVGYGITGGNYHGVKSCHNWFLEMMVEGGILYLGFWVFLLLTFTKKIIKAVRHDECYLLIWTIFTTDFIGLMFSFISWRCTAIWFAIFYVLNVTLEKPEASK